MSNNNMVFNIISSFYPLIGGAERSTQTLSRGLLKAGWGVRVITAWHPGLNRTQIIEDVRVRRFGLAGPCKLRSLTFGLFGVIHILLKYRTISLIHAQNIDTPVLMGMILKLIVKKPLILTINSDQVLPQKNRTFLGRLRVAMMRRWVNRFIAVSESGREGMLAAGIPPQRISLIPNGLETDFFRSPTLEEKAALRTEFGYASQDIILLYLGRLIPSKRADLILMALNNLTGDRRIKCIIVGDGPQREELQALSRNLDLLDRVYFAGGVSNVRDFYWLSDIFIQPSQFEGLSVALLESMACGLAVIASDCKGNLELVSDGSNGLIFPVDDEKQLTNRLVELVDNLDLRTTLGAKASSDVRSKYGKEFVTQAYLDVYQQVLKRNTR